MKRSKTQLLRSLAAVMLLGAGLASCSQDDFADKPQGEPLPDGEYPLTLTASVDGMKTRSAGKEGWTGNGTEYIGVRIGTDGMPAKYVIGSGNSVNPASDDQTLYWQNTTPATVTAWYPYETETSPVNISNQKDGFADFDFLTATEEGADYKNSVTLHFKHQMAKVKYTLTKDESITDEEFNGATVQIAGLTEASFINGELTGDTDGWITPTSDNEALLVPQNMIDRQFIKVTVGKNASEREFYYIPTTATAGELKAGHQNTYTITVKRTGLEVSEISASWENGDPINGDEPTVIPYHYLTLPDGLSDVEVKDASGNVLNIDKGRYPLPATDTKFTVSYSTNNYKETLLPVAGLCRIKNRNVSDDAKYISYYENVFSDVTLQIKECPIVGDYYFSDGTWCGGNYKPGNATPIAVVFHVGPGHDDVITNYSSRTAMTAINGYAAALNSLSNSKTSFGGTLPKVNNRLQDFDVPEIENDNQISYNGFTITNIIRTKYMPQSYIYEFPAFALLDTYEEQVNAPQTSSGWYIPSAAMMSAINVIEGQLNWPSRYNDVMSCSERDASSVWGYAFHNDANTGRNKNDNNTYARAVLTF